MVARELHHFRRDAASLPGSQEMIEQMELLAARARHELSPRLAKEMVLEAALFEQSRQAYRAMAKRTWVDRVRDGE
jgi:hypothetical protein